MNQGDRVAVELSRDEAKRYGLPRAFDASYHGRYAASGRARRYAGVVPDAGPQTVLWVLESRVTPRA